MRGSRAVQKRLTDEETKKRDKRKLKSIFVGTGGLTCGFGHLGV